NYFINITDSLNLPRTDPLKTTTGNNHRNDCPNDDEVLKIIEKYGNHSSIKTIKEQLGKITLSMNFQNSYNDLIKNNLINLDTKKATGPDDIPSKILKWSAECIAPYINKLFNKTIYSCIFPSDLKCADVSPVHKKDSTTSKSNYRPVSVLPSTSKVFERIMADQISRYMENKLSPLLCGFRKKYGTQHALIRLIENIKRNLDQKFKNGMVLMDLSKAFDCLPHELLIAKLDAYGFSMNALKLIKSYLQERTQRVKINSNYSEWMK
ncbi:MAG: hypothetical protein GY714_25835, partial [Desulfobacterales bacterium]|nr:hypothetical protein [Desulfobacterales bacterium]